MQLWFLLAGLGGLASNISYILVRVLLKDKQDALSFGWLFDITRFFIPLILFLTVDYFLVLTPLSVLIFFLIAISGMLSTYFYVKMHAFTQLSLSTIISRLRVIWTPLLAFIIIGERLGMMDYIGIGIVFIGIALVSLPKKILFDKGSLYAFMFTIVAACNVILAKAGLSYISTSGNILLGSVLTIPLFPLLMRNAKNRIIDELKTISLTKLGSLGLNIFSGYCFIIALKLGGSASGVNVIYQAMMVISVLYGIFILQEKEMLKRKILGTIITILGIIGLNH